MKKVLAVYMLCLAIQGQAGTVSYTFDLADPLDAGVAQIGNSEASSISYTQGWVQSGAGASDVAYESNVPGDNLFAISSADIDPANVAYQIGDSRLQFSLTVADGETLEFSGSSLSFDLFAMRAVEYNYIINARVFYNVNGAGWVDLSGGFHNITTVIEDVDHVLNTNLYADVSDTLLTDSIGTEADVFMKNFIVPLDVIGSLSAGNSIEFALFVWDNVNGPAAYYSGVDNIIIDDLSFTEPPADSSVLYTFDRLNPMMPTTAQIGSLDVSEISYTQGTIQSGGGYSDVAYESNVPEDNLFAISSADIDTANTAYQPADSRFQFSLTAGAVEVVDFSGATLSFDLFAMNASANNYIVNARLFYNVDGAGWIDLSGVYHNITTLTATPDHTLNTELYADSTDAVLTGSIYAEADVYKTQFSVDLDSIGVLSGGETVEFALFVWDNVDGNASYYTGVDNIAVDGFAVTPPDVGTITLDLLSEQSGFVVSWESISGVSYTLESCSDLVAGDWAPWTNSLSGTGDILFCTGTVSAVQNFYRVVAE